MEEVWKHCLLDDGYEVSNLGRIRSLPRIVSSKSSRRTSSYQRMMPGRMLKPFISKATGYLQVNLSKKARVNVHRLVAFAFCDGFKEGLVVNHMNGVKGDNRAENLEWISQKENNEHAFRVLKRKPTCLGVFGAPHPSSKAVISTCVISGKETRYGAGMDAVREGFKSHSISKCCKGLQKTHGGRTWRYEDRALA